MSSGLVNLASIANMVAEHKVTWQRNLAAVNARGEDPNGNGSVKESFAHFVASQRIFIACVNGTGGGSDIPARVVREADKLIEESSAWTAYQKSLES